jgi:hypothetical protein
MAESQERVSSGLRERRSGISEMRFFSFRPATGSMAWMVFSCSLLQAESPSPAVAAAARLPGSEAALAMAFRTPLPL